MDIDGLKRTIDTARAIFSQNEDPLSSHEDQLSPHSRSEESQRSENNLKNRSEAAATQLNLDECLGFVSHPGGWNSTGGMLRSHKGCFSDASENNEVRFFNVPALSMAPTTHPSINNMSVPLIHHLLEKAFQW